MSESQIQRLLEKLEELRKELENVRGDITVLQGQVTGLVDDRDLAKRYLVSNFGALIGAIGYWLKWAGFVLLGALAAKLGLENLPKP